MRMIYEAIGPKRILTITSAYVTDGWIRHADDGHGTTAKTALTLKRFAVKTASNKLVRLRSPYGMRP